MQKECSAVIKCLVLFFLILQISTATTMKELSLPQLIQESSDIIIGTVELVHSEWNSDHTMIFTYINVLPTESFKGTGSESLVIKLIGGNVDDIVTFVILRGP